MLRDRLILATPLGDLQCLLTAAGILESAWVEHTQEIGPMDGFREDAGAGNTYTNPHADDVLAALRHDIRTQVDAYFHRELTYFSLPLVMRGTEFTQQVWHATAAIPFGATAAYGEIARAVGRPGSARGVARVMRELPFALFIPAHRVIGADGRIKVAHPAARRSWLLHFEQRRTPAN